MPNYTKAKSVTIANGASLTGTIDLDELRLFSIVMPASWTSANLTFQVSHDAGTTWNNMFDVNGTEYTATAAASRIIQLNPVDFLAHQFIKIRSGTSGSAVNQAAERTLVLMLERL